jgi:hypothetical protein
MAMLNIRNMFSVDIKYDLTELQQYFVAKLLAMLHTVSDPIFPWSKIILQSIIFTLLKKKLNRLWIKKTVAES